jgi:Yip1 domain
MSTPAASAFDPQPRPTSETAPALSEGQRLINVFIAPSKTFTDLKRKASWFVPWLVMAITSLAFAGVVVQKVGFRQLTENQMRMEGSKAQDRMAQMPSEQRERVMEFRVIITKVTLFTFPLLGLLIFLIYAAILMGTFNFGMGTEVSYGTSLAIVVYAQLPMIMKSLLAIIALFAGADPESFVLQNPVASNLGFLVDVNTHRALYTLACAADVFVLWTVVLTGIGFACVSKIKRSTAIGAVFTWYALVTLAGVGIVAVFS